MDWYRHISEKLPPWTCLDDLCGKNLAADPRYPPLSDALRKQHRRLRQHLSAKQWDAFLEAESAYNARSALLEEAAFNLGFRFGVAHRHLDSTSETADLVARLVLIADQPKVAAPARARALVAVLSSVIGGRCNG
jgi:hypothetical protein